MKQKTAIRQLIELLQERREEGRNDLRELIYEAQKLEPVNEQQIKDAYMKGWNDKVNENN